MTATISLKKNEDHRIKNGHLWVFSNEIQNIDGHPEPGDIVSIVAHSGGFLGKAFFNPHSLIAARLLTHNPEEEIDFQFFQRRIQRAYDIRKKLYPDNAAFRLVHGESDFLPGLVIDAFNGYYSIQTFSFGMDRRTTLICDVLDSLFHPLGIVERNESPIRALEQLEQKKGIVRGTLAPVTIEENGIRYTLDILDGQKTGFFFDQRENRKAFRRYAPGAKVLDCFCNEGGFALNAAGGGAVSVVGVDISESAIGRAKTNAGTNAFSGLVQFVQRDCFEFLTEARSRGDRFDLINLDPPSFAKNKKGIVRAKRGYRELHSHALQLLKPGGILSTASCSHHITEETFLEIVTASARTLGRKIVLLEWHGAAPDHPVLSAMPETRYLKFGIFRLD